MAWAIAYAATILAIAYIIPKILIIQAQMRMVEHQIAVMAGPGDDITSSQGGVADFGGGYQ